jgi:hypothetical protein
MARYNGRHRISKRAKIATGAIGLAIAVGALVVTTTAGNPDEASADAADKSFFVDITKVKPNVQKARQQGNASKGTFTVDCGVNKNGHFNPDNFIAQPGIKNGAQHLHDYVGNLTTNADSTNESLVKAGTTCKNGDKSAYFWPVVRIDTEDEAKEDAENPPAAEQKQERAQQQAADAQVKASKRVDCQDVASKLPGEIPDESQAVVEDALKKIDEDTEAADKTAATAKNVDQEVIGPLTEKRKQQLDKITQAMMRIRPARPVQDQDARRWRPGQRRQRQQHPGAGHRHQAEAAGEQQQRARGQRRRHPAPAEGGADLQRQRGRQGHRHAEVPPRALRRCQAEPERPEERPRLVDL